MERKTSTNLFCYRHTDHSTKEENDKIIMTPKKGLICIQKITAKTGTIEVSPDNWVENTKYSWVQLLTKTVAK